MRFVCGTTLLILRSKESKMGLKSDKWIAHMCDTYGMIEPFTPIQVSSRCQDGVCSKVISYGVSSYGYDMRLGNHFKVFTNLHYGVIDPKNINDLEFHEVVALDNEPVIIPPNAFALTSSREYFIMPDDVLGICLGKSTYARCGLVANITALEPGWEGNLTIELSNTAPLPVKVYAGEGIAQVLFFSGDDRCRTTYRDKKGKYMGQTGITLPRL